MNCEEAVLDLRDTETIIKNLKQNIIILLTEEHYGIMFDYESKTPEEQLQEIEYIKMIKDSIMQDVTNYYNNFLDKKFTWGKILKEEQDKRKLVGEATDFDMKKTGIITAASSIIVPPLAPLALAIGLPIIGLDSRLKKTSEQVSEISGMILEEYEKTAQRFYDFICDIREDFHKSNTELDELKNRALTGEDITGDLLRITNPERVGLKRIPLSKYIDYIAEQENQQEENANWYLK